MYYTQHNMPYRFITGAIIALVMHSVVLHVMNSFDNSDLLAAELFSPPTSVRISFTTPEPIKTPDVEKPLIEHVIKEDAIRKIAEPKKIITPTKTIPQKPQRIVKKQPPLPIVEVQKVITPVPLPPKEIPVFTEYKLKGKRIEPTYPKRAKRLHQQGVVSIRVLVSPSGKQKDIKIIESSTYPLLDNAALDAVKQWQFEPSRTTGKSVESWVEVPIQFTLSQS